MPCWPTSARESVSRSSATARRPRAGPIIVSCCSSVSWCFWKTDMSLLLRGLRRTKLDVAREAARVHLEQVADDVADVVGGNLPLGPLGSISGEIGRHRAGREAGDADVVVPHLLHERFAERVQSGLRRAVGRGSDEGVLSRQA